VTLGPLAPAHEQLGDMLMQLGRTEDARAEYRATLGPSPIVITRRVRSRDRFLATYG
jgi:hypothetical protein